MKKMTVLYGVLLAAAFAVAAPAVVAVLGVVFRPWAALRLGIAAGVFAYACALVPRSERRSGRLATLLFVGIAEAFLVASTPAFGLFVLGNCFVVWAARALLLARGALHALSDAALVTLAFFSSVAVCGPTGSFALAVWVFFLVLAAGALIGKSLSPRGPDRAEGRERGETSRFENAFRSAENAITALTKA